MGHSLDMNDNRIIGLTNAILYLTEAVNKQYVDNTIIKENIKASHTSKNVFKFLMDDVNEWSTEYGAIILLDLRTVLSRVSFNKDVFLKELNILDDTIVDFSPLVTKFEKQQQKQFLSHQTDTVYASIEEIQDGRRVSPDSTQCKLADTPYL